MKYKTSLLTTAITASLIASGSAATLLIGDINGAVADTEVAWDGTGGTSGVTHNSSPNGTVVTTVDGVTFTLSLAATGDSGASNGNIRITSGGRLGVSGTAGTNNTNTRLGDTETLKFTLSVSGASLDSLSLDTFKLSAFTSSKFDVATYSDGTNNGSHAAGGTQLSYTGGGTNNMSNAGLAALTKDNTATWELTIGSTDDGTNPQDAFEIEYLQFDYTVTPVPEPSSTALFGLGGLALLLRRRK